ARHSVEPPPPPAGAAGVSLIGDVTGGIGVLGDAERLQQAIGNLITNAIKFTPPSGRVDVGVTCVTDVARIVVRDTGEGLDPTLLPHIFDRFLRGDSAARK